MIERMKCIHCLLLNFILIPSLNAAYIHTYTAIISRQAFINALPSFLRPL